MHNATNGFMGGYGLWTVLAIAVVVLVVVAIVKMMQKK
jgi:heme exporter protein D